MATFRLDRDMKVQRIGKLPRGDVGLLRDSVQKWAFIVKQLEKGVKGVWNHGNSCALCRHYSYGRAYEMQCSGCPVFGISGQRGCGCTPWRSKPTLRDAQRELEFLSALLAAAKLVSVERQ